MHFKEPITFLVNSRVKTRCGGTSTFHIFNSDGKACGSYLSNRQLRTRRVLVHLNRENQKGVSASQSWEPEGRYRYRFCAAIAPFWFLTEHLWTAITPFWLSTDEISFLPSCRLTRKLPNTIHITSQLRLRVESSFWWVLTLYSQDGNSCVEELEHNLGDVSHNIPRTEMCRILPSVRRELRNMIEGYASHLLLSP